ncbi:hypothetical protein [Desulfocurvus sp. DL9XJH121]
MREICARCRHWQAPEDEPLFCEVKGQCLFRPPGDSGEHAVECLTEACGYCEFFELDPDLPPPADDEF